MNQKKFNRAFENSTSSIAIQSTRRIFFNHLTLSIEERGHFHVDQMYGSGSGILIKFNGGFYLLTADHVIRKATNYSFNNPSPFWITSRSKFNVTTMYDFLMPAKAFHIGELIADEGVSIDLDDMVLIELFQPGYRHMPDHFLDFDTKPRLLKKSEFFEGQLLLAVGYPFEKNNFEFYDEPIGRFTHSTPVHRHIVDGICLFEYGEPFMTLNGVSEKKYGNLSGISGGIVTNIQMKSNQVKMAGLILSAGSTIIRFLPSYVIEYALRNFVRARQTLIDPAINRQPTFEELILMMKSYLGAEKTDA
jgi:hypothetical protein